MRLVAESFVWPFRAKLATWVWGCVCVLLFPILFIPLLGYAVYATRYAEVDPHAPPPPWRLTGPILWAGGWTSLVLALSISPFVLAFNPLAAALGGGIYAGVIAFFVLLFVWGVVALIVLPHATARIAASGDPQDLFDVGASLRGVKRDFATWNLVVAAIVTAWAIAVASAGLLCVGLVPGVFYAILVSAHASATLHGQASRQDLPAR